MGNTSSGGSGDTTFNNPYANYSQMSGGKPLINGLPEDISNILAGGSQQLGQQAQNFLPQIQQYLGQAQTGVNNATQDTLGQLNQNANQQYQNLTQQLSPTGGLGQQLAGEYNNYGITPQSGAFQQGLGNQYGQMMQSVNQNEMGVIDSGGQQNQTLGSQMGTAPLSLLSNVLGQQQSLTNEATQLPIQNWQNSMGYGAAQNLGNQNASAQNYGAQMGLLGNLGGGALSGIGAAYGK